MQLVWPCECQSIISINFDTSDLKDGALFQTYINLLTMSEKVAQLAEFTSENSQLPFDILPAI